MSFVGQSKDIPGKARLGHARRAKKVIKKKGLWRLHFLITTLQTSTATTQSDLLRSSNGSQGP